MFKFSSTLQDLFEVKQFLIIIGRKSRESREIRKQAFEEITEEDFSQAMQRITNGKSPKIEEIKPEMLKMMGKF